MPLNNGTMFRPMPTQAKGAQEVSLCAPVPSQGVPARGRVVKNRILRQLSGDELKSVQPWLTPLELRSNVVLHEPGDAMERVYFPLSGMISLLAVMQSSAINTGA